MPRRKERAADYVTGLSEEQMAGLMLFSSHERAPGDGLTDEQKTYLSQSFLRNVLNAGTSDAKQNVQWVNEMQAYVETLAAEGTPYIPVNYSSDPRSDASNTGLFTEAGEISKWPSSLGLAATFSPDTVLEFAKAASSEYKALGISTALSPPRSTSPPSPLAPRVRDLRRGCDDGRSDGRRLRRGLPGHLR
ncbi:glycoside hydrolase family 3 N-terminal domain-containing protein [Schaalia hyovaginalis]|uniref:glycoside hydrolase family 3 N-terminal domain-containing protein n=1 Tax=Schaalia hyovaginalis TaxID=29316 RepID=UPI0026F1F2D2|nr:glycoside hydrolase family 3 N-terminal domain-containing protein [Schaalia hyovaginalis]MDD7554716.1 glycoside hydrolase family 3 N-terminal domain-containing protein [Schaalia hyovaginalis]MDY3094148.1 glycoside hydrolase family 3 N-terminal domain-containing protein [Schaalia hyovaginalis]